MRADAVPEVRDIHGKEVIIWPDINDLTSFVKMNRRRFWFNLGVILLYNGSTIMDNLQKFPVNPEANTPETMGRMNDPDGSAFIKGTCGDTMEMYLVIAEDRITEVKFFTDGCGSSVFCGETGQ